MSTHSLPQFPVPPINMLTPSHPPNPDVVQLIRAIRNPETREEALLFLSKNRSIREDMAPLLWNSFGTMTILLQEIISVYRLLSTPQLTDKVSHRLCNALVLLQGVATHPNTKLHFIKAKIPLYLYPFLNNPILEKPHEYIRLTSLGIIGALVKADNEQAIKFILKSDTFPCFLHCMEIGTELTKTVAAYILNRVLCSDEGLKYCCNLADRFYAVGHALRNMAEKLVESGRLAEESSKRLLKHIIWCFYRLSQTARACDGLRYCLPKKLKDSCVINAIHDDQQAIEPYLQLFQNVANGFISTTQLAGLNSHLGSLISTTQLAGLNSHLGSLISTTQLAGLNSHSDSLISTTQLAGLNSHSDSLISTTQLAGLNCNSDSHSHA